MSGDNNQQPNPAPEGGWIFLSHSNKDVEKVREIRNVLEERGHKPLMFFLKCLEDDDARLPELLKAEIAARHWFILCDSPNATASKWVQEEKAMIKEMGKESRTLDLTKGLTAELHKLDELSKRSTVYLSYAASEAWAAERIRQELLKHDYAVTTPADFGPGDQPREAIERAIDQAVARGFVLVLLSPAAMASQWCNYEIQYALECALKSRKSNVIPVAVTPPSAEALPPRLAGLPLFDLSTRGDFEEGVSELIRDLKTRRMG